MTKFLISAGCIILVVIGAFIILNNRTPKLRNLDVTDQVFLPCGNAPHCIASDGSGYANDMTPFPYVDRLPLMIKKLDQAISGTAEKRGETEKLIYEDSAARHYVVTTKIMHYKDDLLFVFDDSKKIMHYRSSSRIGYDDFNQNKTRMDEILSHLSN